MLNLYELGNHIGLPLQNLFQVFSTLKEGVAGGGVPEDACLSRLQARGWCN